MEAIRWESLLSLLSAILFLQSAVSGQGEDEGRNEKQGMEGGEKAPVDLYLLGLFPMRGQWPEGPGYSQAVLMGLEDINRRKDILPGYRLNMVWNDTQCDRGYGVNLMVRLFYEAPTKIFIIGAGCSTVSQATAETSHLWNVLQLSYGSTSPALSDRHRYKRFFRVSVSENVINPARAALMREFNWRRAATIHEGVEYYSRVTEDAIRHLQAANVTLITSEIFTTDPALQVSNLKRHDARIIVLSGYVDKMRQVMCEAYKQGLYGPRYVWMIPEFFPEGWWAVEDGHGCTGEELTEACNGLIGTRKLYHDPRKLTGIAGINVDQFWERVSKRTDSIEPGIVQGYDAAWTAAIFLNHTKAALEEQGYPRRLEDFAYDDDEMGKIMYESMWKVNFKGIKGDVYFDRKTGSTPATILIQQIQDGKRITTGVYYPGLDGSDGRFEWFEDTPLKWKGGRPPPDSTLTIVVAEFVNQELYLGMCITSLFGISVSLVFLIFNIYFRKQRYIKMSSPVMNNIILFGCLVSYVTIFLQDLEAGNTLLFCKIRSWTMSIGFSLAFGALFVKTWRVHVIFTNKTKKLMIGDRRLAAMVGILVVIDIVLLTTRELVDPLHVQEFNTTSELEPGGDLERQHQVLLCTSPYATYFQIGTYAYKGLLLAFGVFLAWETRKVTIPALNDSQYIGMCIYNVLILSVLGALLSFALDRQVSLNYAFTSGFLVFGTFITTLIIFIPKILKLKDLKKTVEDEPGTVDETKTTMTTTATINVGGGGGGHTIEWYTNRVQELEAEVAQLKAENERLKKGV